MVIIPVIGKGKLNMEPRISMFFSNLSLRTKYTIAILSVLLFIVLMLFIVHETTKATVTVMIDGEEHVLSTHAETVGELLEEQQWEFKEYDEITPSLDEKIESYLVIKWKKAKQVALTVNGEEQQVWTTADDVESFLKSQNITVKEQDKLNQKLDQPIENGMNIVYEPAFLVTLNVDGKQLEIWTTSTTVADFLKKKSVALNDLDRVEPAMEETLTKPTEVNVIRVEKVTDVVEEEISFATVTKKDSNLENGKEKVIQEGTTGLVVKHYEVTLENGVEVSRQLIKEETKRESKDRIVAVGTKQPTPSVSRSYSYSSSPAAASGKTITVVATAYTANCQGCSGITATGINLNHNRNAKVIAVDPSVIPLGTRVYVEGYGEAIAADTGSSIKGNKIDVYVPTRADAAKWGKRTVKVTILN